MCSPFYLACSFLMLPYCGRQVRLGETGERIDDAGLSYIHHNEIRTRKGHRLALNASGMEFGP